MIDQFVVSR